VQAVSFSPLLLTNMTLAAIEMLMQVEGNYSLFLCCVVMENKILMF